MSENPVRLFVAAVLAIAALMFIGASMALNYISWRGQGGDELIGLVLGGVSIAVDMTKAVLPIAIGWAWFMRRYLACAVASVTLLGCLTFSISGALGLAASSRSHAIGGREAAALRYAAAEQELRDVQKQLSTFSISRPQAIVEQLIEQSKQDRRWVKSAMCAAPLNELTRNFCKDLATLRTELASSIAGDELRARAKQLHAEMDKLLTAGVRSKLDEQAEIIARLLGLSVATVQTALPVLLTLLVEFVAAFGLFIAAIPMVTGQEERRQQSVRIPQPGQTLDVKPTRFIREGGRLLIR